MAKAPTFDTRRAEYAALWTSMEIKPSKSGDIDATASRILANKARYKEVESGTGVPWFVIGMIHAMEAGLNFATHLHNGDSLQRRTVQVPKGRPVAGQPPFTWKDSAIDAIQYDGLDKVKDWSIERICFELEKYNGWGTYLYHPDVSTPYLWSGTNHYVRGKYIADGKWSSTAISGQSGAMPILKKIIERDGETAMVVQLSGGVAGGIAAGVASPEADEAPSRPFTTTVATVKSAYQSRSIWAALAGVASTVFGVLTDWAKLAWDWILWTIGIVPELYNETKETLSSAEEMAKWFSVSWPSISLTIAGVCIAVFLVRHLMLRTQAQA